MKVLVKPQVIAVTEENYKQTLIKLLGKCRVPNVCLARRLLAWKCRGQIIGHEAGRFYPKMNLRKEECYKAEQAEYIAKDGSSKAWVTTKNGEKLVIELMCNNLSFLLVF